ncbi:chromosome segregation protein SMC [Parvimonas micra]|uniref:Chromosome partition protein Smc n=1 Tax=Parvimonas micra ATCC 33270 TaxID=411465 RepID=A8SMU2_9FIRM|nr:chromosome segregation protein SMC [Parvimonas micra]EDP23636.1 chromosome segregation protein SMC [Parvimonas micra ATCC 33270]MEB3059670.1 chromosome segregation protein SMC [Parvimonas micra]MEB3066035.1 chromosome segregation protein SMC [Parvimonas micra]RSB91023.1 chromosome segregation protein SMC [Parvimonas micra]VEH98368.1 Chromosome partition protein Smc [Parvimonas micra]
MRLKSIEINGFKSFADKIKLDFETNITAIIGPNGSGKSNVADAVRWVLGEQSAKTLRGSKMEDVIFSGTDNKIKKNYSTVSITFDNSDNVIPIDFKEVTISRKLYRTGESDYFINKSNVRLKEVRELFLDTGVGREGYSIIGQGRIEEIINGKSEDRRAIFEEASGISKIKYQKNESQKKLFKAKDNLTRLRDIIIQNENRYGFLKGQSTKAKKGIALLEDIEKAEFSISYKDYNNLNSNFNKYSENLEINKEELFDINKEFENVKLKISPLKEELNNITNVIEKDSAELDRINKKKNDITNKKNVLIERNKFIRLNNEQSLKLKQEYIDNLEKINLEISEQEKKISEKNSILKNYIDDKNKVKNELSKSKELLSSKVQILDKFFIEKEEIENKISDLETEKRANEIITDSIKKKIEENTEEVTKLNIEKENIEKKLSENNSLLESNNQKVQNIDLTIFEKRQLISELEKELISLNNQVSNINNEINYENKEIIMLKNYIRNYEGYGKSVQDLFKLCDRETELKSMICGTLGELISVEEKYKKAIDTVLSSNLQGIVVHNDLEAKKIIEKIKANKIGRLNFFPISKILLKKEYSSIIDSDILSFANDVITCDNDYRNIVDYFLANTIICENMDIAIKLSNKFKNKFRIVTLDGDVINSWGSISGGYKSSKNSFSIIGRKQQLAKALSDIENLETSLKNNINRISDVKTDLQSNKENLDNLKSEKEDLKLKIDSLQKLIYLNEFDVRKITEKIDEINNYKEDHQGFTSDKEKELILYKEKSILIDDEINKYNLEINKLKNLVLEMEKNEIIVINNLDSIERDINILDNSKNILLENKNSNESKLKLKESELIESELQLKNNSSEIEVIEQLIIEINLKTDKLNNSISKNTHLRKKLILNNEEISKRYSELSEKSLTLEKEIEKNELRISNLKEQFSNLINRLCDEYSLTLEDCERKMELYKNEHFTKEELKRLKEDLRELGSFSYDSIEEFEKVKNELEFQKKQEIDLQNSIEDINKIILKLENTMKKTFLNEFKSINENFSNIFKILFNGGEARLELDSEDILNCGIDIIAKPVGKKMQTLSLMSGGEKSLTAVALLFAIFETKPSPFCILDEVDAALDDSNILRYVEYLKNYLTETQFIMITHRKPTMEMADMIYGVTMEQKGVSKIVSMTFNKEKK